MSLKIDVLAVIPKQDTSRYFSYLNDEDDLIVQMATTIEDGLQDLANRENHTDVLILSNEFAEAMDIVSQLRLTYPRLIIILVDEEADFAIAGQADAIATDPFTNNELIRYVQRLTADRHLETLRADSLPAVRQFAKQMREAVGEMGKLEAAAKACRLIGYDYIAIYKLDMSESAAVPRLKVQNGKLAIRHSAPERGTPRDIIGWVAAKQQSRIATTGDKPSHPFVERGTMGAVASVPISINTTEYGVLIACQEEATAISQDDVRKLELVSAQLAVALSKDTLA